MLHLLGCCFRVGGTKIVKNKYVLAICKQMKHSMSSSNTFRKNVRRLLFFFYKEVHPDLTVDLPDNLKKINSESLSVFHSYLDILSSPFHKENNEGNVFIEKKLRFFKVYENEEKKIIKNRYTNFMIHLPTISANLSADEREHLAAKLICNVEKALGKTEEIKNCNKGIKDEEKGDWIFKEGNGKQDVHKKNIYNIWEELTKEVKDTEALFQLSEDQIILKQKRKAYFNYLKKKLEAKYQRIQHKKRRKEKLNLLNEIVQTIVDKKFGNISCVRKNWCKHLPYIHNPNYQIFQSGYDPNLIFFHKDLKEKEKKAGIENLCGLHLKDDADKWLLESCLKLLKNHETPIPVVIYSEDIITLSSIFGIIYIPYNFELNDFFLFLENNIDKARAIRKQVIQSF